MPSRDENGKPLGGAQLARERKARDLEAREAERLRTAVDCKSRAQRFREALGPYPETASGRIARAQHIASLMLDEIVLDEHLPLETQARLSQPFIAAIGVTANKTLDDEKLAKLEQAKEKQGPGHATSPNPLRLAGGTHRGA